MRAERPAVRDWRLETLDGQPPMAGSPIMLRLSTYGELTGHTGVSAYRGRYERLSDGVLSVSRIRLSASDGAQPPQLIEQETAYTELLRRVNAYRVDHGRLQLLAEGEVVLEFVPSNPV
jgi:heat shock protein HslJ